MQQRPRGVLDALVEDLGRFVLVVPVDVDAGLAAGAGRLGRSRRGLQLRNRRRLVVVPASRPQRRWRRGRRGCRRWQRRRTRTGGQAGRRRWRRKAARLRLDGRRRRCRWDAAARRRRRGRLARRRRRGRPGAAAWYRRGQAKQRLLTGGRRIRRGDGTPGRGQGRRRRSAGSRLLCRQSVENVEIRTRLVAHRCCSLCSFSLTLLWRLVLETPAGCGSRCVMQRIAAAHGPNLDL